MLEQVSTLLQQLIKIPSFSSEEKGAADHLARYFSDQGVESKRVGENIIVHSNLDPDKPNLLLCSHLDTVKPNAGYTRNPHQPTIEDGKLYGLGANDAGGPLVCLIGAFLTLYAEDLPYNLWLAAVAEEEISGSGGAAMIVKQIPEIQLAIVGEPTSMKMAIAEKGLFVVDGYATGIPGHAAHFNTLNPIEIAARDIARLKELTFERVSALLGKTKVTVSQINAGTQHNQVPAQCHFVIDVRVNELYTNEEVFDMLQTHTVSLLEARSLRLRSSGLQPGHSVLNLAEQLGIPTYGSATLSDQALLPYPSIKIGPGDTKRSHTADEFIYLAELQSGVEGYVEILRNYQPTT